MNISHVLQILIMGFIPMEILSLTASSRNCIMPGTFEINDGTCQNYYMCVYDGVEYVSYDLKCASSMVFNPSLGYCMSPSTYVCTQVTTATTDATESSESSTTPMTSSEPESSSMVSSESTEPSSVTESTSETSETSETTETSLTSTETTSKTPSTSTETTPKTPSTSTETTPKTPPTSTETTSTETTPKTPPTSTESTSTTAATCDRNGRFEIKDPNCQKYYYCYINGTNIIRYDLQCPNSLRFNPKTQKCVLPSSYPCNVTG